MCILPFMHAMARIIGSAIRGREWGAAPLANFMRMRNIHFLCGRSSCTCRPADRTQARAAITVDRGANSNNGSRLGVVRPLVLCPHLHRHSRGFHRLLLLHHPLPVRRLLYMYEGNHRLYPQGSHAPLQRSCQHGHREGWMLIKNADHFYFSVVC